MNHQRVICLIGIPGTSHVTSTFLDLDFKTFFSTVTFSSAAEHVFAASFSPFCWTNIVSTLLLLGIRSLNVLLASTFYSSKH
jgi:hypothetical protein